MIHHIHLAVSSSPRCQTTRACGVTCPRNSIRRLHRYYYARMSRGLRGKAVSMSCKRRAGITPRSPPSDLYYTCSPTSPAPLKAIDRGPYNSQTQTSNVLIRRPRLRHTRDPRTNPPLHRPHDPQPLPAPNHQPQLPPRNQWLLTFTPNHGNSTQTPRAEEVPRV